MQDGRLHAPLRVGVRDVSVQWRVREQQPAGLVRIGAASGVPVATSTGQVTVRAHQRSAGSVRPPAEEQSSMPATQRANTPVFAVYHVYALLLPPQRAAPSLY